MNSKYNSSLSAASNFQREDVEVLSRERVLAGFLTLERLQLRHRLFKGGWSETMRRELLVKDPAVGVLLFDPIRDEIVFVRQFRAGMLDEPGSPWLLELVAGMVEAGEQPLQVALRESKEEAGCVPTDLVEIGSYYNSPGTSNEKVTLFCGRVDAAGVEGVFGLSEEHEDIEVLVLPYSEALLAVESGIIDNAMSIIAVQWLQLHKQELLQRWNLST